MGYDVWGSGEAVLPKENLDQAMAALRNGVAEMYSEEWEPDGPPAKAVAALIENRSCAFNAEVNDDGGITITTIDDRFRRLEESEWIFNAIGKLIAGEFEFTGEDDLKWRWSFEAGAGLKEVNSDIVWGQDIAAPKVVCEIEGLIYEDDRVIRNHEDPQAVIDQIESILRKAGFGPFAGLDTLDAIAKAVE